MMDVLERPRKVLEHLPEANHYDTLERDRMAAEQSTHTTPERWLPVPGYEGYYEVSDQGRVRSVDRVIHHPIWGDQVYRGKVRRTYRTKREPSYTGVTFSRGGKSTSFQVHRLVLDAFVGPCPEGKVACHENGDSSDNRLSNLRYDTQSENLRDKRRHGTDHEVNKTHCPRNHPLVVPNLVPSKLKQGRRNCLACDRAKSWIKGHPEKRGMLKPISDSYYGKIMRERK